jgi:copper resistance protein D
MTYVTLVTLHLLGAVVWIGGMLFLGLVLVPVLRGRPPAERAALLHAVGRRFLTIGWIALGTLLVTGPILWALRGFAVSLALAHKLVLVAIILGLSVLHDFVLGPRLATLIAQSEASGETARLRRRVALLARLNVLLALVVLILGVAISRGS